MVLSDVLADLLNSRDALLKLHEDTENEECRALMLYTAETLQCSVEEFMQWLPDD
jgi:hypothetical protein